MATHSPAAAGPLLRTGLRIAVIVAFALLIHQMLNWLNVQIEAQSGETARFMLTGLIVLTLLVYALLIAIPFVPGIEIGLSLMLLQGPEIAPLVYLFTVIGLSLAYLIGRFVPYSYICKVLEDLRLMRACQLVQHLQPLSTGERVALLRQNLPKSIAPFVVSWRYLVLAVAINVPGNSVVGGGGGICMVAGLTRLFSPGLTFATLALAVAPVPLGVYLGLISNSHKRRLAASLTSSMTVTVMAGP